MIYHFSLFCLLLPLVITGCDSTDTTHTELNGHLLVVGSTALQPLAQAAAGLFQKSHPHVQIEVVGGGSILGLQAVTSKKADIGNSDVYADPAVYPDSNLTDHIVCIVPFTMIIHPSIKITSLTNQQIIDIFSTRTIRNWNELGGPDLPIVPVVRPANSGTRATFRKYILGGRDESGALLQTDSSTQVRDTVAHTPGAIGYIALSVLDSTVQAIGINGEMATPETIQSRHYTFWSYEHMYTLGEDNKIAVAYTDFMLTPEAQQLAQKLRYIPITTIHFSNTI